MSKLRYALFAIPLAGCMTTPPTEDSVAEIKGNDRCMPNVCGTRSQALFECTYFWELSSNGQPNDVGVHIVAAQRSDGTSMKIVAVGDRLSGVHPVTGAPLADHAQLQGTVIIVMAGVSTRTITIERVVNERFFVAGQPNVEAYELAYTSETGGAPLHVRVVAFTGDRYDPLSKLITVGPSTSGWINFACKNTTPYRQHLLGYTEAAQSKLGITTTLSQRQGVLNALSGNACGTGRTWTNDAEPITLSESKLMLPPTSPYQVAPATYEAIWNADGAVCMNIPRLATTPAMVNETLGWMANECGAPIPACTSAMLTSWPLFGDAVTGNPPGSTP